mgnify:CR=1 FL=1
MTDYIKEMGRIKIVLEENTAYSQRDKQYARESRINSREDEDRVFIEAMDKDNVRCGI